MGVNVFRIDDRLIHGQIITAWISHADANEIVVADDSASKDELKRSLLEMATPKSMKLKILNLEDSANYLCNLEANAKVLLLVRDPKAAFELLEKGVGTNSINIGNLNMKKGKQKILSNMWVFPEDVDYLKKIMDKGVELEVRAVPNEKSQNVLNLLDKVK